MTIAITVSTRERFDELANRNGFANYIREQFDDSLWMSDRTEYFTISSRIAASFAIMYIRHCK